MSWLERRLGRPNSPRGGGRGSGGGRGGGGGRGRGRGRGGGGGGNGDPFAADVVFLTNFDGTHGGVDAVDEGPFGKTLVFSGNAVLSNAQTYSEDYGTALDLDGNGDFVTVAGLGAVFNPGATPWTYEVRIRPDTEAIGGGIMVFNLQGGQGQMAMWVDPRAFSRAVVYADKRNGAFGNGFTLTNQIFVNEWVELAVSFDGDILNLYKNGARIAQRDVSVNALDNLSEANLSIGQIVASVGGYFAGQIQAMRFTLADRYGGANYTPVARWSV